MRTARYTRQYDFIKQLCHAYETTPDDFQKVVGLMQNMQECGQPPQILFASLRLALNLEKTVYQYMFFYFYVLYVELRFFL